MFQKIYLKMHPASCTDIHHDVTGLKNHGSVKNTKTWISSKQSTTLLQNEKALTCTSNDIFWEVIVL